MLYVLPLLALIAFLIYRWSKTDKGADRIDGIRIKLPIFGMIWLKYQVALFSRTLSTLLSGGLPLVPSLETAARSIAQQADCEGGVFVGGQRARGQGAVAEPGGDEGVSSAVDGDDRGGRIDGRAAADAELGRGVF